MLASLLGSEAKRKRLLKKAPEGPVRDYLSVPFPDNRMDIHEVPMLSLDFETTGLNPVQDRLLSVGYVGIQHAEVQLATAVHKLIRPEQSIAEESVVIHRITDDAAALGDGLDEVIPELLKALTGKVMLAHHGVIETSFLARACTRLYGVAPVFSVVDTLKIARQWYVRRGKEPGPGDLRLFNLRKRFGLPDYNAHNALSDAISTAELFLAQVESMDNNVSPPLRQFLA